MLIMPAVYILYSCNNPLSNDIRSTYPLPWRHNSEGCFSPNLSPNNTEFFPPDFLGFVVKGCDQLWLLRNPRVNTTGTNCIQAILIGWRTAVIEYSNGYWATFFSRKQVLGYIFQSQMYKAGYIFQRHFLRRLFCNEAADCCHNMLIDGDCHLKL